MRASGILLHITSLPSRYGIGTLGQEAYRFADFLHAAGQRYWQLLPLGQTGYGDSPYQTCSTYAGNPYLIDLELLQQEGLLTAQELQQTDFGSSETRVDFAQQYRVRYALLYRAFQRGEKRDREAMRVFRKENPWLRDYALYMAIKRSQGMKSWADWPQPLRLREKEALRQARHDLREDIRFFSYLQLLFFRQWDALHAYTARLGISLIGDLPIYVPYDSADVWANPALFALDENRLPTAVAGCPPDAFTEDGQLWGNPLYNWKQHRKSGYRWWLARLSACARLVEAVRIDHFRGLESYWAIPAADRTARGGTWEKGPGTHFIRAIQKKLPEIRLIAEDLGYLTPAVHRLRKRAGYPGMKVLQFAFEPSGKSAYLPHNYDTNCICYPGTHDNPTLCQWLRELDAPTLRFAKQYLQVAHKSDLYEAILRAGMQSRADLFILPMQDLLHLGKSARMNLPGTVSTDNWSWRMKKHQMTSRLAARLLTMTRDAHRAGTK